MQQMLTSSEEHELVLPLSRSDDNAGGSALDVVFSLTAFADEASGVKGTVGLGKDLTDVLRAGSQASQEVGLAGTRPPLLALTRSRAL